eukprot:TRINITY_DN480_c0_g1_i1.p1 TRINITY_DN480_c0_g1~~TRINITY_DN480_c0_g1_i1.p1  ORF type:complete len:263 (-),score=12.35 TRINITY_DN480_c0_g1_i1:37-732(-)
MDQPKIYGQVWLNKHIIARTKEKYEKLGRKLNPADKIPIPRDARPPYLYIPVSKGRPWQCQISRDGSNEGRLAEHFDSRLVVDLRWSAPILPRRENRVWFSHEVLDKFGMPQPTFDFTLSEADVDLVEKMYKDCMRVGTILGGFVPGSTPKLQPLGSNIHYQGSHRMGPANDGTCVTDLNSRVWGFKNLILGGNGMIPSSIATNPTLTAAALALKAAYFECGRTTPSVAKL